MMEREEHWTDVYDYSGDMMPDVADPFEDRAAPAEPVAVKAAIYHQCGCRRWQRFPAWHPMATEYQKMVEGTVCTRCAKERRRTRLEKPALS